MSENPKTTWLSMIKDGRDERIAELEAALDGDAPGSGAHWRFWSDKARAATDRALVATTRAEAAEAEVKRLRRCVESVASYAWRTDPPNANRLLTDTERLSAIKHHPTVKEFAAPHIALAEKEAGNG